MLYADVSEHSVCSIFTGDVNRKNNRDDIASVFIHVKIFPVILRPYTTCEFGTECSETSEHDIRTPEYHPQERIQHSEKGEFLKSEECSCYIRNISSRK